MAVEIIEYPVLVKQPHKPRRPTAHRVYHDKGGKQWIPQYYNKETRRYNDYYGEDDLVVCYPTKAEAQEHIRQERRLEHVRIYDNGGTTIDRYTAVYAVGPLSYTWVVGRRYQVFRPVYECVCFNSAPYHPQGFGQHAEATVGKHLGKRIKLSDLNEDCQRFVLENL